MSDNFEDDFNSIYGTKYAGAADLNSTGNVRLRIARVEKTDLRGRDGMTKVRYVLHFVPNGSAVSAKALPLNRTNALAVAGMLGKDHRKWVGQIVELSVTETGMGPGVRVTPMKPNGTDDAVGPFTPPVKLVGGGSATLDDPPFAPEVR